jgi:hypothetical protein
MIFPTTQYCVEVHCISPNWLAISIFTFEHSRTVANRYFCGVVPEVLARVGCFAVQKEQSDRDSVLKAKVLTAKSEKTAFSFRHLPLFGLRLTMLKISYSSAKKRPIKD